MSGNSSIKPTEKLALSKIIVDSKLQFRAKINNSGIQEWAQALKEDPSLDFEPVVVFVDPGTGESYLADGFQRNDSYTLAGRTEIPVLIKEGTKKDAKEYSLGANAKNGNIRTNADKRKAVDAVLDHPEEWAKKDEESGETKPLGPNVVAKLCRVSKQFVLNIRKERKDKAEREEAERLAKEAAKAAALVNGKNEKLKDKLADEGEGELSNGKATDSNGDGNGNTKPAEPAVVTPTEDKRSFEDRLASMLKETRANLRSLLNLDNINTNDIADTWAKSLPEKINRKQLDDLVVATAGLKRETEAIHSSLLQRQQRKPITTNA